MKGNEIVKALRCSATKEEQESCEMCQRSKRGCFECINSYLYEAASLIEQMTAENTALREKQSEAEAERDALLDIAKNGKDCDTCKHCEVCVQPGIDIAHWCDRCLEKCPCHGCGEDHWEWRGLPEAPEEGDKHGTADK